MKRESCGCSSLALHLTPQTASFDIAATVGHQRRTITLLLGVIFTYVFLANTWLGDDSYITFRVIWNFLHGYGLVFNPGERVQAYTHPLWMLVITAAHAVTREFFFTVLAVSYCFSLAAVMLVVRSMKNTAGIVVTVLLFLSSKAFFDYTSSGLENPLSYFLLALFYIPFLRADGDTVANLPWRRLGWVAGFAFVNRMDSLALYALPLAWLAWRSRASRQQGLSALAIGVGLPAVSWLVFATWYYGFPLPNTYYAKVATGIPSAILYSQGIAYVLNSIAHDPITLGTIGLAVALAVRASAPTRLAAASCVLYVVYTISVGGDFMSGRFFTGPFFVAVLIVAEAFRKADLFKPAAIALVAYNIVMPLVPAKTTPAYQAAWAWRPQNGIKDERGFYHPLTNILTHSPFRHMPDATWIREGQSFREGPEKVTVQGSIGYYGLMAGPDKHILDRNALSDPLLARLPVSPALYFEFYSGHFFRDIPDGYLETISTGENRIADEELHAYYDTLLKVLKGPLMSPSRFAAIWSLNLGKNRGLAGRFAARRPINLSIRASNERFGTDTGDRDAAAGTLKSTGRAGFLQLGPGIPARKGLYRARWIGTVDGAATGNIGFVDVWAGGKRLARRDVTLEEADSERRQFAQVEFVLPDNTTDLEYRLWVNGARNVTLERVELFSAGLAGGVSK